MWGLQGHMHPLGVCVLHLLPMFENKEGVGVASAHASSGRVCAAPTADA